MRAIDTVIAALKSHEGPTSNWLIGEPCVPPPVVLQEALATAAIAQNSGYPPAAGLPELREILAARHHYGGKSRTSDQVVVTHGAKGGLLTVFATLLGPGDEIIHPQPCYPAYPAMATMLGAIPVAVPEGTDGFDGWTEKVRNRLTERTRAVVIASPSNPSGATLHSKEANALVELCRDRGVRLICDEAYVDFRFAKNTTELPAAFDPDCTTVIQIRSASKSWALCGWRLGWVVADRDLASRVASRQASLLNPASGPAQAAMVSLPLVKDDYIEGARTAIAARFATLKTALAPNRVIEPEGGFYLWIDISDRLRIEGSESSTAWCRDLARRTGVALWPGEDFLGPGRVRLAATSPSPSLWELSLEKLIDALG